MITELRDGPEDPLEAGWVVAWQRHPGPEADEGYWEPLRRRAEPEPEWAVEDYRTVGDPSDPAWRIVWLHSDHLGSVRMTSLADGSVESYHTYEPFGWEVPQSNSTSSNSHRFTGHERDRETGLDYMLARYHVANLARFASPDPLGPQDFMTSTSERDQKRFIEMISNPQTWNAYAYTVNNPLRFSDPTGAVMQNAQDVQQEVQDRDLQGAVNELVAAGEVLANQVRSGDVSSGDAIDMYFAVAQALTADSENPTGDALVVATAAALELRNLPGHPGHDMTENTLGRDTLHHFFINASNTFEGVPGIGVGVPVAAEIFFANRQESELSDINANIRGAEYGDLLENTAPPDRLATPPSLVIP